MKDFIDKLVSIKIFTTSSSVDMFQIIIQDMAMRGWFFPWFFLFLAIFFFLKTKQSGNFISPQSLVNKNLVKRCNGIWNVPIKKMWRHIFERKFERQGGLLRI